MAAKQESCAFTGHRPGKLPWGENESDTRCTELRRRIADALETAYAEGWRHFICGMAQGCDLYFCEEVQNLKRIRDGVTLEAALPYADHASRWKPAQREKYLELLEGCDKIKVVTPLYSSGCLLARDRYLVDHASLLLAAYDGTPGGTKYTIEYALKQGLEVRYIPVIEEGGEPVTAESGENDGDGGNFQVWF